MGGAGRVLGALILPFVLTVVSASAQATVPLDAAAIRAKIAAATGPRPSAYREIDQTTYADGSTTIEHDFVSHDDHRYVYDSGPLHTESGTYQGNSWYMNDNGQVVMSDPHRAGDPREHPPETATAFHTPYEGYLLATLDSSGHGTKEYVDAASWQIVRYEDVTADGTTVATYDDVRADHGRTFAHHIHVDDRTSRVVSDMRITSYLPGGVWSTDVSIPNPRRALVTFPAGTASAELPSTFSDGRVYVRVTIGKRGLDFLLDTGASGITIDGSVADELGLPRYARSSTVTVGRYDTARTIVPEMSVGPLDMRDVAVQIIPQGWDEQAGVKVVGLLGFDFLAELGVTIDYEHKRVTVVPGQAFQPPADPYTTPVRVRVGNGSPETAVAVNGVSGDRFILDTGNPGTFLITDYFARHHPDAFKNQRTEIATEKFSGIGGYFDAKPYKMSDVRLVNLDFHDWTGYRIIGGAYESDEDDGLIGSDFLRLFTVVLDYPNSRLYLVPNSDGRKAMGLK
jgi:predicted aspartyl protease